jgi:hypothetical protein
MNNGIQILSGTIQTSGNAYTPQATRSAVRIDETLPAPQNDTVEKASGTAAPAPQRTSAEQEARRLAWRVQLGAALTPAGAAAGAVLDILDRAFTPAEFKALNTGFYHSPAHPVNVAAVAGPLAKNLGASEADQDLIVKAAIIHDADARPEGTPARVPVTLQWMDDNRADVQGRFGWNDSQFNEAKAIIARTDFPFSDATSKQSYHTSYDGKSPLQVYREQLDNVAPERRADVMRLGLAGRFADQIGNYTGTPEQGVITVHDLERELKLPANALLSGSAAFQAQVGKDVSLDQALAESAGVPTQALPDRETLMAALPSSLREALAANIAGFGTVASPFSSESD